MLIKKKIYNKKSVNETWDKNYQLLYNWKKENILKDLTTSLIINNIEIGSWIDKQRQAYKNNKLSQYQIK